MRNRIMRFLKKMLLFPAAVLLLTAFAGRAVYAEGLMLMAGASASMYVYDQAGLLSDEEAQELDRRAAQVSEAYGCGVYIVTAEDYTDFCGGSVEDYSEQLFDEYGLGLGEDRDCILLVLSMAERDYDLMAHGGLGNAAFTDYGKSVLADVFLDDFGNDDWYEGFSDYIDECGSFLELALNGTPEDIWIEDDPDIVYPERRIGLFGLLFRFVLIPFGLAAAVLGILKGKMRSVAVKTRAEQYATGQMEFGTRRDRLINVTERRIHHEPAGGHGGGHAGGTHVNIGGHSHSSGKF